MGLFRLVKSDRCYQMANYLYKDARIDFCLEIHNMVYGLRDYDFSIRSMLALSAADNT